MASTPKMEYEVFLCIFQKKSAMATLGLKEMGKFLWEGREKCQPCWLSQFSKTKLRQPSRQTFFPIGKMQKKSGIMKRWLEAMPLLLLDDLLSIF